MVFGVKTPILRFLHLFYTGLISQEMDPDRKGQPEAEVSTATPGGRRGDIREATENLTAEPTANTKGPRHLPEFFSSLNEGLMA